jgi:hypothetical protein
MQAFGVSLTVCIVSKIDGTSLSPTAWKLIISAIDFSGTHHQ